MIYCYQEEQTNKKRGEKVIELLTAIFGSLAASWIVTAIWVTTAFLILGVLREVSGWWVNFTEWIKGLFKGGEDK